MPIPHHPDDEFLAALAEGDEEARAQEPLASHVADCRRCAGVVADLRVLRASLADLPDVRPARPLRLLPPVEDLRPLPADRLGSWVRRAFAPVLALGATLAMVGLVGTAAPSLSGSQGGSPAAGDANMEMEAAASASEADGGAEAGAGQDDRLSAGSAAPSVDTGTLAARDQAAEEADADPGLPAERSPWPMVLFTGVATVVGAVLLRWILVPRAG